MFKSINIVVETTENLEIPQDTNPPWIIENPTWRQKIFVNLDRLVKRVINPIKAINADSAEPQTPSNKLLISGNIFFDDLNKSPLAEDFSENFYKIVISRLINKLPNNVDMTANSLKSALFVYEMNAETNSKISKKDQSAEEIMKNTDVIIFGTTFILRDFNHFIEDWKKNVQFSPNNDTTKSENNSSNKRAAEINFFITKFRRKNLDVGQNHPDGKHLKKADNWQKPKTAPTFLVTCEEFNKIFESADLISSGIDSNNYDNNRVHTKQLRDWEFWYEHRRLSAEKLE